VTAKWVFPETGPYQVQGRDLSEDNFAQEDRTSLEILMREALQNPLDARERNNTGAVKVRISVLQPGHFDAEYLAGILNDDYGKRLEAAGGDPLPDFTTSAVLVLEDFGTTGLEGNWNEQNADGPNENWNAFWFREGEGAKSTVGSNGRAGQGKITYYRTGAARAVFGFTVRKSDGAKLLMGRSAFRRVYPYDGKKYLRHSFWCTGKDQPLPTTDDAAIMAFRKAFALTRLSEPGLSLVIPFPVDFDAEQAIRTIITDFYYPIARGSLEISIGKMDIAKGKVDAVADQLLPDDVAREKRSAFSKGFRGLVRDVIDVEAKGARLVQLRPGWDRTPKLKEDVLPSGALGLLRTALDKGERISVRCPVTIRPKKGASVQSWFDVHLEVPEELERVEEAYIRRDLLIGSENHLAASAYLQKARGLTLVSEPQLSAFLADAEEPTHLKWNGSRPRLSEGYSNPQATLRAVRNAAPRLLALISNELVKRDTKALAKYFTHAAEDGSRHVGGGTKPGGKEITEIVELPESVRKPFRIATGADRIRVVPNGAAAPMPANLPMSCILEVAYEGLDQDPFRAYDPFDFDLADNTAHAIKATGANITDRRGNRIWFDVTVPQFELEVPGFDPNIRLRARLTYTEKNNGASVSEN